MTKDEALKVIKEENLTNYQWFEDTMVGNHYYLVKSKTCINILLVLC